MSLKKLVEDLIAEIEQDELSVDEMSTTGNVAGYNTPMRLKILMVLMKMMNQKIKLLIESTNLLVTKGLVKIGG